MQRRATTTIQVDDGLIMRPANTTYTNDLLEAFEETWPEVSRAMPWILPRRKLSRNWLIFSMKQSGQEESEECIIGYSYALGMRPFLDY